jgi:anti-sigma factor RsiW
MRKPSDERLNELLVAYADGELDGARLAEAEALLERDASLREEVMRLRESAALIRAAFDQDLRDEVPERLIAAARGETLPTPAAQVVPFPSKPARRTRPQLRWWVGMAAAASVLGIVVGTGVGYYGIPKPASPTVQRQVAEANTVLQNAQVSWLDNVAGYHKLFAAAVQKQEEQRPAFVDFPSQGDNNSEIIKQISERVSSQGMRVPNLKPWGLKFEGARMLVIEGRPAAQLFYTTDNKAIGPLTVVIGTSKRPDMPPTFEHRDNLNILWWRNRNRAYAICGQTDIGYLWGLANDIAWQLDAI